MLYLGLCLIGWVMLWRRPHYAFALTYAVAMALLIVVLGGFLGGFAETSRLAQGVRLAQIPAFVVGLLRGLLAFPLIFLCVGVAIVALRKLRKSSGGGTAPA